MCGTDDVMTGFPLTDKNHTCACGTAGHAHTDPVSPASGHVEHYLVSGMTCAHCVSSVTEELSEIDGVQSVRIALNAGGVSRVMVASDAPVDPAAVRAAVAEAGYDLVDPAP